MKILFTFGGLPHYYNLVLNKLNAISGLKVTVVVPDNKGKTLGSGVSESQEGIEFKVIKVPEHKAFYGKPAFKGLKQIIEEEKPDIIVTGWPYVLSFLFNPLLLKTVKQYGVKLIYKDIPFNIPKYQEAKKYFKTKGILLENLESGNNKKSNIFTTLKYHLVTWSRKKYFNLMDAHVYYTDEAYDIIPTYGFPKEKIFITYNSPDTDQLLAVLEKAKKAPQILPPSTNRIIHIGRLVKWKRVDLLIEAFEEIKKKFPDAELVIIGNGPEEAALKIQAKKINLEDSIIFTGGIYDQEILGKYLLASSVYILAGMGGLSINEAMCFGKPIICSVADGTEKILVREGFNGKYFENGNKVDLYNQIDYLLSRPEEIKRYGENSLKIIREEINIHTVISGYIKAFNYVTKNKESLTYQIKQ